jgi:hypothetical protein
MGGPMVLTFDVTAANIVLQIIGAGSTSGGMDGTFEVVIDASDGHIGESDLVTLTDAGLFSTDQMALGIGGIATANLAPGSARFLDFIQPVPAHIGPGGWGILESDSFLEATVIVTGAFVTTFQTATSAGILLPMEFIISTTVVASDIVVMDLFLAFPYEVGISDISLTITLDLIMIIEGTAHVPDPSLGGLTAMGLAGAGLWMRRRRS